MKINQNKIQQILFVSIIATLIIGSTAFVYSQTQDKPLAIVSGIEYGSLKVTTVDNENSKTQDYRKNATKLNIGAMLYKNSILIPVSQKVKITILTLDEQKLYTKIMKGTPVSISDFIKPKEKASVFSRMYASLSDTFSEISYSSHQVLFGGAKDGQLNTHTEAKADSAAPRSSSARPQSSSARPQSSSARPHKNIASKPYPQPPPYPASSSTPPSVSRQSTNDVEDSFESDEMFKKELKSTSMTTPGKKKKDQSELFEILGSGGSAQTDASSANSLNFAADMDLNEIAEDESADMEADELPTILKEGKPETAYGAGIKSRGILTTKPAETKSASSFFIKHSGLAVPQKTKSINIKRPLWMRNQNKDDDALKHGTITLSSSINQSKSIKVALGNSEIISINLKASGLKFKVPEYVTLNINYKKHKQKLWFVIIPDDAYEQVLSTEKLGKNNTNLQIRRGLYFLAANMWKKCGAPGNAWDLYKKIRKNTDLSPSEKSHVKKEQDKLAIVIVNGPKTR